MKKIRIFQLGALVLAALVTCTNTFAFPSFDPFTDATASGGTAYTPNGPLAGNVDALGDTWSAVATTVGTTATQVVVTNNNTLTYAGLPAGGGNQVLLRNVSGPGARLSIGSNPETANSTLFYSLLLDVTGAPSTAATFNIGFNNSTGSQANQPTVLGASLYFQQLQATTYEIGFSKTSGSTIYDNNDLFNLGQTVFVVCEYQVNDTNTTDDVAYCWINPSSTTFGASAAPMGSVTITPTETGNDIGGSPNGVGSLLLLNRSTSSPKSMIVEDVRVGHTWCFVTGGPEFKTEPAASLTVNDGSTATITVKAISGGGPLSYFWAKNGTGSLPYLGDGPSGSGSTIAGSSSSALTLSAVTLADAASYTCVVSNSIASITSIVTALTIADPSITLEPVASQNLPPGTNAYFNINAVGSPTLTFQWSSNAVALTDSAHIVGSATTNLTLVNLTTADSATYTCLVTSGGGTQGSSNAVLLVSDPAVITSPTNVSTTYGATATFAVTAGGTGPLTYQWQKNGVSFSDGPSPSGSPAVVSGSTTATLTFAGVAFADDGSYSVIVTNGNSATFASAAATLTVKDPIVVTPPSSTSVVSNTTAVLSVIASGTSPIAYQWTKGGVALTNGVSPDVAGSTTSSLTISPTLDSDAGSYKVILIGADGATNTSTNAIVSVLNPAFMATPPLSRAARVGDNVAFAVGMGGTGPFTYQWQSNGVTLAGATTNSILLTNIQQNFAASYKVTVGLPFGGPATATAVLTVKAGRYTLFPTNLVLTRVGGGSQTLVFGTGNTLYIDQYDTNGNYLNSAMIPDNTNLNTSSLIVNGQDASSGEEGLGESVLGRSPNQHYLSFAGYNVTRPYSGPTTLNGDAANVCPRCIGEMNGLGYYTLPFRSASTSVGSGSFRSAQCDATGTNFWTTSGSGGVRYSSGKSTTIAINGSFPNSSAVTRVASIFSTNNGANYDLYISTAQANYQGLYRYTPAPTTQNLAAYNTIMVFGINGTGQTSPTIYPTNINEFAVSPDGLTIYVADCGNNAAGPGSIQRWDISSGIWTLSYMIPPEGAGNTAGARGLLVDFSASPTWGPGVNGAVIYATTGETNANYLIKAVDAGSGTAGTILAQAGTNTVLRSVKYGLISDPVSLLTTPQSASVLESGPINSTNVIFSISGTGSLPLSYQWKLGNQVLSDGLTAAGSTIVGSATTNLTILNVTAADAGTYTGTVTNDISSAPATATLTVTLLPQFSATNGVEVLSNGDTQLSFYGNSGQPYRLWATTDLSLPVTNAWTLLASNTFGGGVVTFVDTNAPLFGNRYYTITSP